MRLTTMHRINTLSGNETRRKRQGVISGTKLKKKLQKAIASHGAGTNVNQPDGVSVTEGEEKGKKKKSKKQNKQHQIGRLIPLVSVVYG